MFAISSSLLRSLSGRKTLTCSSRTKFWWGHDTLEDKAMRKFQKEQERVIKWNNAESSLENRKSIYAPKRIRDEAGTLGAPGLMEYNYTDFFHYIRQPIFARISDYKHHMYKKQLKLYRDEIASQMFLRERLTALGPDLTAAHFLCYRNCLVRFKGHDHWTMLNQYHTMPEDIPKTYQPGWFIEAIDASESILVYEGMQNMRNLVFLKYLDLSYCPFIDAWCLDRLTGEYQESLEYLDLSGCPEINWNALECLWRLQKLKTLVLFDLDHVKDLKLICIMLLDIFPDLDIRGVDYIDAKLLKGTEHEHLLEDLDELRILPLAEGEQQHEKSNDEAETVKAKEESLKNLNSSHNI